MHTCAVDILTHFVAMVEKKKGKIMSVRCSVSAELDDYAAVTLNGDVFNKTVRATLCELICNT